MGLVDVNVLGGLLSIDGFHNSATAFANGVAGGAKATVSSTKPLIKINAADALCAQVSADGISLCNVDGLGLPTAITSQVNGLLKTLSSEINQITSKILGGLPLISETAGIHPRVAGRQERYRDRAVVQHLGRQPADRDASATAFPPRPRLCRTSRPRSSCSTTRRAPRRPCPTRA